MTLQIRHPATAAEAEALLLEPSASIVGGGTVLQLGLGVRAPNQTLVALDRLPGAHGIGPGRNGWLRLGAATLLEALRTHPEVGRYAPLLAAACTQLGALAVRNLATLGGNVGWRIGDCTAALIAHDALAELASGEQVALAELLRQPRLPLILALHVPPITRPLLLRYEKIGHREAFSPARIALAIALEADAAGRVADCRIGLSGAGLHGRRLPAAETWLRGHCATDCGPDATDLHATLANALPDDPPRARLAARLIGGHVAALLGRRPTTHALPERAA